LRTSALIVAALAALSTACNGSLYSPTHLPRLSATSFLAFGDSMTEGADADTCPAGATRFTLSQLMLSLPVLAPGQSYPSVLQQLLRDEYPTQQITVENRGVGGELAADGAKRLPGVLQQIAPQVTLILEGANDVNQNTALAPLGSSVATMIQAARAKGNTVFIATVPAQRPNGVNGACRGFNPPGVPPVNEQIRTTARVEGAVLVDVYSAFGGVPEPFIGKDGLHPTVEGYARIAEAFLDAISARLRD
jgi:lysophospholipase L1-like esterase